MYIWICDCVLADLVQYRLKYMRFMVKGMHTGWYILWWHDHDKW